MQPRNQTARQRFAQFLRDIDYGRSAGDLQFAYAIVPLPIVVDYGPLAAVDTADSDGRGRFIADTLAATLSEAHESSWMRIPGGRSYDAGGGGWLERGRRSPGFSEYYMDSSVQYRPQGIRIYEGFNAILARESFTDRECFADAWLWELVKPAHRFARRSLLKLAPNVTRIATAGVLHNDSGIPLRIVAEFRPAKDYLPEDCDKPLVLGDPPFEVQLSDEAAPDRIISQMRRHLYNRYGIPDDARSE